MKTYTSLHIFNFHLKSIYKNISKKEKNEKKMCVYLFLFMAYKYSITFLLLRVSFACFKFYATTKWNTKIVVKIMCNVRP